jgi:Flp pilus assembly protein TadD
MDRIGSSARTAGFTLCSAMVAALLAGCAGQSPIASAEGAPMADSPMGAQGQGAVDKALAKAEARVARSANSAVARAELAQLYLAAGRFDSAATTFEDAVALGDKNPRTGLGLALSYIGSGRNPQALAVLSRWRGQIPAGDLGLAVALAGRPDQGVSLLTDTLRGGENSAEVRQNLAYAYALDGRWGEARVIAAQDVPADQLDARLQEWASHARPDQAKVRVAGLLGAPLRIDPGQPAALALNGVDHAPRMAAATVPAPAAELPAVEAPESPARMAEADLTPAAPIPAAPIEAESPPRSTIERAFEHFARAEPATAAQGRHLVQLGSFSTREGAQRAWGIFQKRNPALRDHSLRITEAQVNGRRYFRVAAEGFERGSAQSLCSTVKQRGGGCLAYADAPTLPAKGAKFASR